MSKVSYILFHVLVMALVLAISVLGLFLLSWIFKALGALVILLGILIFFSGTSINFVFDDFGNEYLVTNIQYRAIILAVTVVLGAMITILPTFFYVQEIVIALVLLLIGFGMGFRLHGENDSWKYNVSDGANLLASLVPMCYMLNAGLFIIVALFELPFFIGIISTVLCLVPHILRVVWVYRDSV